MKEKLSLPLARRIALAAQGFAEPRPAGPIDRRHLNRVLARLGLLQIDSVSAVVRAHYMPLFSRLGPYPMSLLDDAAAPGRKRRLFEYWAHEASFLPLETWPLMQWRMQRAADNDKSEIYGGLARFAQDKNSFIEEIYAEVKTRGPIAASEIEGHKGKGGWWAGRTPRQPSNGCSGPAASPRIRGAASNASMIFPSASSRKTSSTSLPRGPRTPIATCCAIPSAPSASPPMATCATISASTPAT